mgnify:CR=1 FL=1
MVSKEENRWKIEHVKTCDYNDDLLCDKKGIWITDDYSCNKWEFEQVTDWRDSMLARFLRRGETMEKETYEGIEKIADNLQAAAGRKKVQGNRKSQQFL